MFKGEIYTNNRSQCSNFFTLISLTKVGLIERGFSKIFRFNLHKNAPLLVRNLNAVRLDLFSVF